MVIRKYVNPQFCKLQHITLFFYDLYSFTKTYSTKIKFYCIAKLFFMKTTKFFLLVSFLLLITNISAQDYCMTSPIGFGRNATGGNNGAIVLVKNRTELKNALKASGSSVIIITEDILFGEGEMISEIVTNKTLLGLKGIKLTTTARTANGGILGFKNGSNNVIIRNLIFEGPGAYDVDGKDLISNTGCTNLWVDHCEFYDGVDGNFDNTNNADNISISWCKFGYKIPPLAGGSGGSNDHRFSNLIGGSKDNTPADGHYSITFQYCYWSDGCKQRMPRARNAELHLLNCYYNTNTSDALAIGLGAGVKGTTCYVEGTDFKKVKRVVDTSYDPVSGQSVAVNFINCLSGGTNSGTVSKPEYSYTAIDVSDVESVVASSCGAGANLDVTLTGKISSTCISVPALEIPSNVEATATDNSITVNWDAVDGAENYTVKLCYENTENDSNISIKEWDFANWTINTKNADANLILDGENRFNYKPATSAEELVFANGNKIPDTEGLRFTAGADTKLRLGFNTGLLYLNGSGIKIKIPCSIGNYITIEGPAGNAEAVNRGYSVVGAKINTTGTSDNITNGTLTEAGAEGTWSYIATANEVELTTIQGGMNIRKIIISSGAMQQQIICSEYVVSATLTWKTITGLTKGIAYTYQVKATKGTEETEYSSAKTITTESSSSTGNLLLNSNGYIIIKNNQLSVVGFDTQEINIYNSSGNKILSAQNSQQANVGFLNTGFYIVELKTKDGLKKTEKIIID